MRDLTEEELKWVSKDQLEHCDCEGIECPVCNVYMPENVAAPLFEVLITLEVERRKKAEESNQREKAILAKPENERTHEEKQFIFIREMMNKLAESKARPSNAYLNRSPLLFGFDPAKKNAEETITVSFRRPVPSGS